MSFSLSDGNEELMSEARAFTIKPAESCFVRRK